MSRSNQPTREQFLKDVAKHQMRVVLDQGIHRHLRFGIPGDSNMHFHIVTFPGYMTYTGDMGTFVFQRTEDMFQFFRRSKWQEAEEPTPIINLGYWAEKLEADCRHGGHEKYDPDTFKRRVIEAFRDHCRDEPLDHDDRRYLWQDIKDDVLDRADEDETRARVALENFESHGLKFQDTFEWSFTEYTYRYVWACYAIAWAVMQYDTAKSEVVAA